MSERILVTGGAGFIGSRIARAYIQAGHEVAVFDNLSTGHSRNVPGHAKFYGADIVQFEQVSDACRDFRPTVINHHAAQSMVKVSARDPLLTHRVNVLGTAHVLQAAVECGARRVIFASSGAVYGDWQGNTPLSELDEWRPLSAYALSKLMGEEYLRFYEARQGIEAMIFRYGNVYGPGQNPHGEAGVVAVFAGKLRAGEPVMIFGNGKQTRDYIHVDDVTRANLLALDGECGTYNIATGQSTELAWILAALQELTGNPAAPQYAPATPGDARHVRLGVGKAQAHLGFTAQVELATGLETVVEHLRNHADR